MTRVRLLAAAACCALLAAAAPLRAQGRDAVLRAIHEEGMQRSALEPLAQALLDSIGPRLTGSPGQAAAHRWAEGVLAGWGVAARSEPYGRWEGWERGVTHVDLLEPRVRTLEARLLAWSRGTDGPVTGGVVHLPDPGDAAAFQAWLAGARGKWVLMSPTPATCRPIENWQRWAQPQTLARLAAEVAAADTAFARRVRGTRMSGQRLAMALGAAGVAGLLTTDWTGGWGTEFVHAAWPGLVMLSVGCEDFGLLARLAERRQGPVIRVDARVRSTGLAPAMNTVGEIRGRALPGEYVVLSAHFDSRDAASGATDNGSGALVMMEAMRILRQVYPRPNRTLLVGHWSGEEQGLNGSRAFAEDHPDVVGGIQALLNQDTGTGRIDRISLQGFTGAGAFLRRWLARVPAELADGIALDDPGLPSAGSSDHSSFVCRGAPGLWLLSTSWDYGTYTWHTNRDTYDKLVFADLRRNAVLLAMLAYLAAEDPERVPRTRRELPANPQTGAPGTWPRCLPAERG
ncbi:MAG TPA: M20/M25/M40 family metallo-hydrolase [Longimicrobium sp.]|nr:M20/M25/M40 family metallo-hydrolase [Longimicrobium sp.]